MTLMYPTQPDFPGSADKRPETKFCEVPTAREGRVGGRYAPIHGECTCAAQVCPRTQILASDGDIQIRWHELHVRVDFF